ncbi:MAG: hypothetical protein JSV82_05295 [Planctomycetota bacterium]|nr:MAG: hypothetical protein JSV82_05295 [Planctomycetota bacterium]
MSFRFYADAISQASRRVAGMIFVFGLVLIGFGFMIYFLPRLFATLAAVVFFVVGIGCLTTGVKIFLAQKKLDQINSNDLQGHSPFCHKPQNGFRENVQIHSKEEEDYDI